MRLPRASDWTAALGATNRTPGSRSTLEASCEEGPNSHYSRHLVSGSSPMAITIYLHDFTNNAFQTRGTLAVHAARNSR